MDKIKLLGKEIEGTADSRERWIELTPQELKAQLKPDLTKLKSGDKLWAEATITENEHGRIVVVREGMFGILKSNIIAVFPQEAEPEKKEPKLPEKLNPINWDMSDFEKEILNTLNALIDIVKEMADLYPVHPKVGKDPMQT